MSPGVLTEELPLETLVDDIEYWERLYNQQPASLTIVRTSNEDFKDRQIYLTLDDHKVGTLMFGETFTTELDPGPHHFVAELPGFPAQEATYVLQAGDKARVVRFEFTSAKPSVVSGPPPPATAPPSPPLEHRPIPTLSYVLGGVTLTATVTGAVLGGLALARRSEVQNDCAPLCPERDVRSVQHLALAADVAFAVALLGAGATVFSYVTRPSVPVTESAAASPPLRFRVLWTGWGLAAAGSF